MNKASPIVEGLFLSNGVAAFDRGQLQELDIKLVLNVAQPNEVQTRFEFDTPPHADLAEYHAHPLPDIPEPTFELLSHLHELVEFLADHKDKVCLVHCVSGMNRSATVVIAYLMYSRHWTLRKAMTYVMDRRPIIHPCSHYQLQLLAYQDYLHHSGKVLNDEREVQQQEEQAEGWCNIL